MEDRFKFRAWDKEKEIMVYCWVEATEEQIKKYCAVYGRDETYNCWQSCELCCLKDYDKHFIVEQCTGLKDKNGKLIYEGDIVKSCLIEGYVNYIVKWDDGNWGLFFGNGQYDIGLCEKASKEVEIIGNIHTNKELLDDNTN